MMPHTVPNRPMKGVTAAVVASSGKRRSRRVSSSDAPIWMARCTAVMSTLNAAAAKAAISIGPSAMTDVTGFGLLGHLHELVEASGVTAKIEAHAVPAIEGALELIENGDALSGGSRRNREFVGDQVTTDGVPYELLALAFDPQTSGGLLVALPPERAATMQAGFESAGLHLRRIGSVEEGAGVVLA